MADDFVMPSFGKKTAPPTPAAVDTGGDFVMPSFGSKTPQQKAYVEKLKKDSSGELDSFINNLGLGWGNKIRAAVGSAFGGDNYDKRLADLQASTKSFEDEHPIKSFFGNLGGSMLPTAGIEKGLGAVANKVAPSVVNAVQDGVGVLPFLARAGTMIGKGAGYGALAAAGNAAPGQAVDSAKDGLKIGALTAGGLGTAIGAGRAAANVSRPVLQKLGQAMGMSDPAKFATSKFTDVLSEDGMTPQDLVQAMRQHSLSDLTHPVPGMQVVPKPVVAADAVGPNTLGTLKSAVRSSPTGNETVSKVLGDRSRESATRVMNDVADSISNRMGATSELNRILEERQAASKPLYDAALAVGEPTGTKGEDLRNWFNTGFRRDLLNGVRNTETQMGRPFKAQLTVDPNTQELKWVETPSIADLHVMKQRLDGKLQDLWDPLEQRYKGEANINGTNYAAGDLQSEKKNLVGLIEDLTPDGNGGSLYAAARKTYSDGSLVKEALQQGNKILRTRPEDVALEYGKLNSQAEQEAYRAGVASAINDVAGNSDSSTPLLRNLVKPKVRDALDQVFPNDEARQYLNSAIGSEQAFNNTAKVLAPSVQSRDFMESDGSASPLVRGVGSLLAGRPINGAANLMQYMSQKADAMAPAYGEALANLGMMGLPEAQTFASDYAARQANPLRKVGGALSSLAGTALDTLPYAAAVSAADSPTVNGALSSLTQDQQ